VREQKRQRDKRAKERKALEADSKAIEAAQIEQAKLRRRVKEEKLRIEATKRDAEYFARTADRRLGAEGVKEQVAVMKEQERQAAALVAAQAAAAAAERRGSIRRTGSVTGSMAGSVHSAGVRPATASAPSTARSFHSPRNPADLDSDTESDASMTQAARAAKALRELSGPLTAHRFEERMAFRQQKAAQLKQRQESAALRREEQQLARNAHLHELSSRSTVRSQKDKDEVAMALRLKDVQMIWTFLIATLARIGKFKERKTMSATMVRMHTRVHCEWLRRYACKCSLFYSFALVLSSVHHESRPFKKTCSRACSRS
jgi:hypothetical protein